MSFNLTYLYRIDIDNKDEGLREPSGIVLDPSRDGFWTVSDDTKMVFRLDLDGRLRKSRSIKTEVDGLEGITIDPAGKCLYAVCEDKNSILKLDIDKEEVVETFNLADMDNWGLIADFFERGDANKGLEGIAWDTASDRPYVMKEGDPGLLIELSRDFKEILSHQLLDRRKGFVDPGVHHDPGIPAQKVDFSDICYDATRAAFWIISDKAQRVYLYSLKAESVLDSAPLSYGKDCKYRVIEKAEGVSYDAQSTRLYVGERRGSQALRLRGTSIRTAYGRAGPRRQVTSPDWDPLHQLADLVGRFTQRLGAKRCNRTTRLPRRRGSRLRSAGPPG